MLREYLVSLLLFLCVNLSLAKSYSKGDFIPVLYNKIFSTKTQRPHSFTELSFICPPYTEHSWQNHPRRKSWLVIDQDLRGDRLIESDYKLNVLENKQCETLCAKPWTVGDSMQAMDLIKKDYQVEWWFDDLPGATASYTNNVKTRVYRAGFPLGQIKNDKIYINNHVTFNIIYVAEPSDPSRIEIKGFEVYPDSIAETQCQRTSMDYMKQEITERRSMVSFTYSVKWTEMKQLVPSNRWDTYILPPNPDPHVYSTINGVIVSLVLSVILAVVLLKTRRRDSTSNNSDDVNGKLVDEYEDVVGWRLIHRDVFRRPLYGGLLAPILGIGSQFLVVALTLLGALLCQQVHPAKPSSLLTCGMTTFLLTGFIGGFSSARIYKTFRGKSWLLNAFLTATVVPGGTMAFISALSFMAWSQQSSLAISFNGWMMVAVLWMAVLLPGIVLGSYMGNQRDPIEHPVRPTQMPRIIPRKRWYQTYTASILLGGLVPFVVSFIDLYDIFRFAWQGELYWSSRYVALACLLMALSTSMVTVVLVFFQLCSEDYHWWWMSFAIGSGSSIYVFGYAIVYYLLNTEIQGVFGALMYLVYMLLACGILGLCTGTAGFFSAYMVVRKIYSAVKVD